MMTKLFAGLILAVAATVSASGFTQTGQGKSCCAPGADCCYPGTPCCVSVVTCLDADDGKGVELPKAAMKPGCKCCAADDGKLGKAADKHAKPNSKSVVLTIDDMTCSGCAKSVTKALSAVDGVEAVTVDLKAKTATVTPKGASSPSAKSLWEAVEKAEYKPTKLEGPDGKFDKKPAK